jgi:RNA polymerase sigma-70 factor (ECF subfamily)
MALLAQIPDRPPATSDPDSRHHHQPGLSRRAMEWGRASVEPRTWAAFWQVAVDGRAPAAVAFDLGMSLRAVYEANFRVRRGIRQELTEVLD